MTKNALLSRYDALLSDLDGVVYAGPFAIEGAPEALNRAEEEINVPVIFVTNNASRSVESVAEHLRELACTPEQDASSAPHRQAQHCLHSMYPQAPKYSSPAPKHLPTVFVQ